MSSLEKKNYWIIGLIITILSFVLLYIGIRFVLGNELIFRNLTAFLGFSVVSGLIASMLIFFRFKVTFVLFGIGLIVGFFDMYRAFVSDLSGWGDLIGIMSLFMWSITGLVIGLLIQFGYYLYKKMKR